LKMSSASVAAIPWVERYRPKSLADVSHQTEVISTLRNAVETDRLPHLLFYGPPGTGKTSVALALCRTLWHPSHYRRRVLELNASDERGISIVRDKIKQFASLAVGDPTSGGGGGGGSKGIFGATKKMTEEERKEEEERGKYPNPPFKVIILDEADTVTKDAQAALRRIIEAHSKVTRFILICNYVTRIIEPLASRCAKFRFQPLPPESMRNRLRTIADAEHVRFPDGQKEEVLGEILELAGGDMRRAVTTLQSAHALSGGKGADDSAMDVDGEETDNNKTGVVQKGAVAEMAGLPPPDVVDALLRGIKSGSFSKMEQEVHNVVAEGWAAQHILSELSREVVCSDELDEMGKAELSIRIAEAEKCLIDGSDEVLQLLAVGSLALRCYSRVKKKGGASS